MPSKGDSRMATRAMGLPNDLQTGPSIDPLEKECLTKQRAVLCETAALYLLL